MPDKYDILKESISSLANNVTDVEALKTLGNINAQIDELKKSEDGLIERHSKLLNDYREMIIHAELPPRNTPDESGSSQPPAPKSLETIIDEVLSKRSK